MPVLVQMSRLEAPMRLERNLRYIIINDADIGSLKSLHTSFDKYLDHMLVTFEQNRMLPTIQNFVLFDKKWLIIFDNVLTPFGRHVTETIV